jgi:LPPG:FO 2-phospho-L-lactate transferase
MIVVLCGGTGAARLARGLAKALPPKKLVFIGNVGDNIELYGLSICPDLDTVMYALSGLLDDQRGWGLSGETFRCLERLRALSGDAWFGLGDLDLATHMLRTAGLKEGASLSEVTRELALIHGLKSRLIPSTDVWVETHILTHEREDLHYEEFFIKYACEPSVQRVVYRSIQNASPAPGVLEAIAQSSAVVLAPSNPLASILPIVNVPGIKEALAKNRHKVWAISPMIENAPLPKSELRRQRSREGLLKSLGLAHTPLSVAGLYREFASRFVLDTRDLAYQEPIEALGYEVLSLPTDALTPERQNALAESLLQAMNNRTGTSQGFQREILAS